MSKRHYHHGALREALLEAGERVLGERGFAGFTLRECARRAGVSHAAPKHHFADARQLLAVIAARGFTRLTQRLEGELAEAVDLDGEMVATTRAYVKFAVDNPELFRLMFRSDLLQDESEELATAAASTYTTLTNVILRQRGEEEIEVCDLGDRVGPALIDDIVIGWSQIHGLAGLLLEKHLAMVPEEELDAVMTRTAIRVGHVLREQTVPGIQSGT